MKQTENKMKKYLDHIMTATFVSMLVAILFIVVMPGEKGKAATVTGAAINYPTENSQNRLIYNAYPSEKTNLRVTIYNKENTKITDVKLKCESGFGDQNAIYPNFNGEYIAFGEIGSKTSVTKDVPILIGPDAEEKVHTLVFRAYYEAGGISYVSKDTLTVRVVCEKKKTTDEKDDKLPFEPAKGYSFEEKIAPGRTTHVRT